MRYLKIYAMIVKQNLIHSLQYRQNFIISSIVNLLWSMMRIVFYLVAFSHIITVGDWTFEKSLVLASFFMLIQATWKLVTEQSLIQFPHNLYTGVLDQALLKPISARFLMSFKILRPTIIIRFITTIIILAIALNMAGWQLNILTLLLFLWAVGIAFVITYSLHCLGVFLAFWVGLVDNLYFFPRSFINMTYIPMDIFSQSITLILTLIIPLIFIATIPVNTLFESNFGILLIGTLMAIFFFLLSRHVWLWGLKSYSSVSS